MRYLWLPAALGAMLVLTGCPGIGRQNTMPDPEEPPGMGEDHEQRERLAREYRSHPAFARQWGLERTRVDQAHARLALEHGEEVRPGANVTVGVMDSGIDEAHPAFADTRIDEVFLPGATDETGILPSHGTAVASVIAGTRESVLPDGAQGVAPGADLVVFAFGGDLELPPEPEPDLPTEYFPEWPDLINEFDADTAAEFQMVLDWRDGERRIDFLNLSFGSFGIIDGYPETVLRSVYDQSIAAIAQAGADEKTVFVWAAGNANGLQCLPNQPYCLGGMLAAASPGYEAGLAARIPELRGHTVAVVAVKEDGEIAEFSNRCGLAAQWCIAAPGDDVSFAYFGPDAETGAPGSRGTLIDGGTSFAAPMVTGGLAVMKHRFRGQLSNTDLLARLLETANRSGRYADENVYGRGLMDLGAATTPVGGEKVALGSRVEGSGKRLWSTHLGLGTALGDSLESSIARHEFVTFDDLGAPFWHALGSRMARPTPSSMRARLHDLMAKRTAGDEIGMGPSAFAPQRANPDDSVPLRFELGFLDTPAGIEAGHLGLAEDALALRYAGGGNLVLNAFTSMGMEGVPPVLGTGLAWRKGLVGVRGGWLAERESALGTSAEGAFGRLAANALFVAVDAGTTFEAWRIFGGAEVGLTRPHPKGGLIGDLSPIATSALALHAERAIGENQTLRLSVAQPLRVESGRASFSIPVGRTKEGAVVREEVRSGLVPSGRQVDLSARWHRRLDTGGELGVGAYLSLDPGHRAGAEPSLGLLAGYRQIF